MDELDKEVSVLLANIRKMKKIKIYNITNLIKSYNHQLSSLYYFYSLANMKHDQYIVLKQKRVKMHTLMYINLGRGFPKEFMDGHWCYIVKIFGNTKALVIPTASLKGNDKLGYLQGIIKSYNLETKKIMFSKLKYAELRSVDLQRIYYSKGIYKVKTPRKEIIGHLYDIII